MWNEMPYTLEEERRNMRDTLAQHSYLAFCVQSVPIGDTNTYQKS